MEKCLECGRDVSTAKERKQRRLLGSSTAERIRNTLTSFFQWYGLQIDAETLRRGYICKNWVRLIEKYNILHEEVATNVRSVLPRLSVAAGGTTMNVLNPSRVASGKGSGLRATQSAVISAHHFALDGFLAATFRPSCRAQRSTTDTERKNRQKELLSDSETQIKIYKFIAKDSRYAVNL